MVVNACSEEHSRRQRSVSEYTNEFL